MLNTYIIKNELIVLIYDFSSKNHVTSAPFFYLFLNLRFEEGKKNMLGLQTFFELTLLLGITLV